MGRTFIIYTVGLLGVLLATAGSAYADADVGAVIGACDKIYNNGGTCNYDINKSGTALVGCTPTQQFTCPIGTRTCSGSSIPPGSTCQSNGTVKPAETMKGSDLLNSLEKELKK